MNKIILAGMFVLAAIMLAGSVFAVDMAKLSTETRDAIATATNTRLGTNITAEEVGTGVVKKALQDEKEEIKQEIIALAQNASNMSAEERQAIKEEIKGEVQNLVETRREIKKEIREEVKLRLEDKNITVKPLTDDQKEIIAEKINAKTGLNLSSEDIDNKTVLRAYMSNGKYALIKVMPDTASETAIARLKLKVCNESSGCTLVLKEVGSGNDTRAAYEIKAKKKARILGFIRSNMDVESQVDAETGKIIKEKRPWWSFLAKEEDETETTTEPTEGTTSNESNESTTTETATNTTETAENANTTTETAENETAVNTTA